MAAAASSASVAPPRIAPVVLDWRFAELERAGYPPALAIELAERGDIDLHIAVDLLERGCDAETAVAILT